MPLVPKLSPERVNRRIALGFALTLVLISVGFALSFFSYIRSQRDRELLANTFEVIQSLESVLSEAKDIENGARGYLLTRKETFLEPYDLGRAKLGPELKRLRGLLTDDPRQQQSTDVLTRLVNAKIEVATRQIQLSSRTPNSIRQAYLLTGKVRMDDIRRQVARMIAFQQTIIARRGEDARQSFQNTLFIVFALALLTFAALLISYNMLERELRRRAENETQLRAYEQQLRGKIQELEVSNQELERFAFVASHDMQEPLRKIQTFGDLLGQHYLPQADGLGRTYLDKMLTSADRMSKLIRDLLSFSRLKNQPAAFQRVALGEVIDRVLTDLELPISASGASVSVVGTLPVIDAVPSQMEQLFTNLIGNALKYMAPGTSPRVTVSARRVGGDAYPDLLPDQPYHELLIADNGIGFDEKYLDRIFDVFQRLHAKATYEGTGIGLAICKRVVGYHGGYITARSREGVGTTFVIVLPEKQANVPVGETEPAERAGV